MYDASDRVAVRRFLHFFVMDEGPNISLHIMEEVSYQHPQYGGTVPIIEGRHIVTYRKGTLEAGALETFEAAHRAVAYLAGSLNWKEKANDPARY